MNSSENGFVHIHRAPAGSLLAAFAMILALTWLAPASESPAAASNDPFVALLYRLASNI